MLAQKPTESTEAFHARTLADFDTFLESHGDDIGVLLVVSGLGTINLLGCLQSPLSETWLDLRAVFSLDRADPRCCAWSQEPQWGSSVAAQPWPRGLLKAYIERAQAKGILVCCDEIMCGEATHRPALF